MAACSTKKLRFPNEGLEGGAGWQPAEQHWKKPRFPEGCCVAACSTGRSQDSRMRAWKEGAAWQPAALEEAKIPE